MFQLLFFAVQINVVRAVWAGCKLALWGRFSPNNFWERMRLSGATHATLMDVMIDWLMKAPATDRDREHALKVASMNPLPANHNIDAMGKKTRITSRYVLVGCYQEVLLD